MPPPVPVPARRSLSRSQSPNPIQYSAGGVARDDSISRQANLVLQNPGLWTTVLY